MPMNFGRVPKVKESTSKKLSSRAATSAKIMSAPEPTTSVGSAVRANLKYVSLVVMIVQTTALVLTLRYSRTAPLAADGRRYLSSTAVVSAEVVKTITAISVVFAQKDYSISAFTQQLNAEIFEQPADFAKVSVPAVTYVIQNNLLFMALSKLDAATYQVTYQLKILTTALFSVSMLGKKLSIYQWSALLLLTVGVALVQWPADGGASAKAVHADSYADKMVGLTAVIAACVTSGFSGVYMEKILKGSPVSLWMRNFQMALFSIFTGLFMVWMNDWSAVREFGFFQGYSAITWAVIVQQAFGGLVIGYVVKYADNILKGFAVSLSIILSSLTSYFLLGDLQLTSIFLVGTMCVLGATFLYGYEPKRSNPNGKEQRM